MDWSMVGGAIIAAVFGLATGWLFYFLGGRDLRNATKKLDETAYFLSLQIEKLGGPKAVFDKHQHPEGLQGATDVTTRFNLRTEEWAEEPHSSPHE